MRGNHHPQGDWLQCGDDDILYHKPKKGDWLHATVPCHINIFIRILFETLTYCIVCFCKVNTKWCTRRSWRRGLIKRSHSFSYPTVPSYIDRHLLSFKSKGFITAGKKLGEKKSTFNLTPTNLQVKDPRGSPAVDDSSDESGPEDEVVVSIDSPSRLSFP